MNVGSVPVKPFLSVSREVSLASPENDDGRVELNLFMPKLMFSENRYFV